MVLMFATAKMPLPRIVRSSALGVLLAVCVCGSAAAAQEGSSYPRLPVGPRTFVHRPFAHPRSARKASAKPSPHKKTKPAPKPKLTGEQLALQQNTNRAVLAYQAMQHYFYIPGSGLYTGEPKYSFLWPFSQALTATVSMLDVPGHSARFSSELHARLTGLQLYFDGDNSGASEGTFASTLPGFDGSVVAPRGAGGTKYYDDNEWVGIELARVYELTGESSALENAEQIMAFVMSGWQANPKLACPGGEPFSNAATNGMRNTVTTAPGVELAVQLYRLTGNPLYLQFAETAYEWVRQCLGQPNLLYADHIGNKGVVEMTFWSYNQGTMIGAGVLLYQATGNSAFLYEARQTAKAALGYFTPARLASENPFFVAVYFRNLLYLDSVTGDPPGPSIAQTYVNYLVSHHLSSSGLFSTGAYSPQLLVQADITQIYALLASPPSTYF